MRGGMTYEKNRKNKERFPKEAGLRKKDKPMYRAQISSVSVGESELFKWQSKNRLWDLYDGI